MGDNTYRINFVCKNCGETGTISIPDGVNVEDVECPNCKCKTMQVTGSASHSVRKGFSINENFLVDEDEDRDDHGNFNI
ncbi:MAG: hypothetical protein V1678_01245 [Candidatus Aenigmatarchaeota archaeon]